MNIRNTSRCMAIYNRFIIELILAVICPPPCMAAMQIMMQTAAVLLMAGLCAVALLSFQRGDHHFHAKIANHGDGRSRCAAESDCGLAGDCRHGVCDCDVSPRPAPSQVTAAAGTASSWSPHSPAPTPGSTEEQCFSPGWMDRIDLHSACDPANEGRERDAQESSRVMRHRNSLRVPPAPTPLLMYFVRSRRLRGQAHARWCVW